MFCVKCGSELSEGSNFCSKCGTALSGEIKNAEPMGKCFFSIERKSSYSGGAFKIKVFIDGEMVKELKNGESYSQILNAGKHFIYCETFGLDRSETIEFVGDRNEIGFSVIPSSQMHRMFGVGGRNEVILSKIKETSSGTYNG